MRFCPECGTDIVDIQSVNPTVGQNTDLLNQPRASKEKKVRKKVPKIPIIIVVAIFLVFLWSLFSTSGKDFITPEKAVRYHLEGVIENDNDKAMRAYFLSMVNNPELLKKIEASNKEDLEKWEMDTEDLKVLGMNLMKDSVEYEFRQIPKDILQNAEIVYCKVAGKKSFAKLIDFDLYENNLKDLEEVVHIKDSSIVYVLFKSGDTYFGGTFGAAEFKDGWKAVSAFDFIEILDQNSIDKLNNIGVIEPQKTEIDIPSSSNSPAMTAQSTQSLITSTPIPTTPTTTKQVFTTEAPISIEDRKEKAMAVDYETLARNPATYISKDVKFICMFDEYEYNSSTSFEVHEGKDGNWKKPISVIYSTTFDQPRFLQDDMLIVWGRFNRLNEFSEPVVIAFDVQPYDQAAFSNQNTPTVSEKAPEPQNIANSNSINLSSDKMLSYMQDEFGNEFIDCIFVDGQVFPYSSEEIVDEEEIVMLIETVSDNFPELNLTTEQNIDLFKEILGYARNEIYARHGLEFKPDSKYNAFYSSFDWYANLPKQEVDFDKLSETEITNINFIKDREESIGEMFGE